MFGWQHRSGRTEAGRSSPEAYSGVELTLACEGELLGRSAVRVSHLYAVARFNPPAGLLGDQRSLWVLVIIPGSLFVSVDQDHRARVKVFTNHDELLAGDRCCG